MKQSDLMNAEEKKRYLQTLQDELKTHRDNLKIETEIAEIEKDLQSYRQSHSIKTWLSKRGLLKPFILIVTGIIMIDIGEAAQFYYGPLIGILVVGLGIYLIPYVHDFISEFFEE